MDANHQASSRRQFLGRAALVSTGIAVAGTAAEEAWATPPTGKQTRTPLAKGRLDDRIALSTNGPTDFYIQQVIIEPGADSGWHTHPGTALDIVRTGTVTAYLESDDCKPMTVQAGQAVFVPAGVAHLARNDGSETAEIFVTYLVAAGASPRAEAEKPAGCAT